MMLGAVVWCSVVAAIAASQSVTAGTTPAGGHLRVTDSIGDILTHPALVGFGRLLLPWDDRRYDSAMPLRNVASLLPSPRMWLQRWWSRR